MSVDKQLFLHQIMHIGNLLCVYQDSHQIFQGITVVINKAIYYTLALAWRFP